MVLLATICNTVVSLLQLYGILEPGGPVPLGVGAPLGAFLLAARSACAATVFDAIPGQRWTMRAFALLALLCLLLGLQRLLLPDGTAIAGEGLMSMLRGAVYAYLLAIALELLVGLGHAGVGAALLAHVTPLHGWRMPMVVAGLGVAIAALLLVADGLLYITLLFFDISLLAMLLAHARRGAWLRLRTRSAFAGHLTVFLVLPILAYLGPELYRTGRFLQQMGASPWQSAASSVESVEATEVVLWEERTLHVPAGAVLLHRNALFNDVWFLDRQRGFAVERGALHRTEDGGRSWEQLRRLRAPGVKVRFSVDGERGWTGDPAEQIEITRDGGRTWQRLRVEDLRRETLGKAAANPWLADTGTLNLSPESGRGTLVADCKLLVSDDFAASWRVLEVLDEQGQRVCIRDLPGVTLVDDRKTLVVAGGEASTPQLYRRDEQTGRWGPVCRLVERDGPPSVPGRCGPEVGLSPSEMAFAGQVRRERALSTRDWPDRTSLLSVLGGRPLNEAQHAGLRSMAYDNPAGLSWLTRPGLLLTLDGGQQSSGQRPANEAGLWQVRQHAPALEEVHPLDASRALGWDSRRQPLLSVDGGRIWLPVASELLSAEREIIDIRFEKAGGTLLVLLDDGLWRVPDADGTPRRLLALDRSGGAPRLRRSADGDRWWVYARKSRLVYLTDDGGERWRRLEPDGGDGAPAADDPATDQGLVDVVCPAASTGCSALLGSGRLVELVSDGDADRTGTTPGTPQRRLPDAVTATGGRLIAHGTPPVLLFLAEDEPGRLWVSKDGGGRWLARELDQDGDWIGYTQTSRGAVTALRKRSGLLRLGPVEARWQSLRTNGEAGLSVCMSDDGDTLYLTGRDGVAWSLDAGSAWYRVPRLETPGSWCGLDARHLWLQLDGVHVFGLQPASTR